MQLKDISLTGLSKILLIVNLGIPLLCLPILAVIYVLNPEAITWEGNLKLFGIASFHMKPNAVGHLLVLSFVFVLNAFFVSWFTAAVIRFLAVFTLLGRLNISYSVSSQAEKFE